MALFTFDFKAKAERERKAAELERQKLAREKVAGLMGQAQAPYQMGEEELFPGEIQEEAISSGMPAGTPAGQAPPSLMTKGTGYLGSLSDPQAIAQAKLYGGLMGTQDYESIGSQGMQGMLNRQQQMALNEINQQGLMARQAAKDSTTSAKDLSKMDFDRSEKLRKGFESQTKDFVKVRDAYRRIGASAEDPSAAGDMAMIFNYMKVLDPGSTVREGEYATAKQATGVPGYAMNLYNQAIDGKLLNVTQRADFLNRAEKLYTAQLGGLAQLENQYTGLARNYGLNPKNIIVDYRVKEKEKQKTPPPPAGFK